MASQSKGFHQIHLHKSVKLPQNLANDGIVIFRSSSINLTPVQSNTIDNTSLNLLNDKNDVVLHISIRRAENAIVFNARTASGGWGNEERIDLKHRFDGNNTTIAVYIHPENYQIIINGKTGHYFKKRIQGDVQSLAYNANEGQVPVFSDPIAAETYQNWAALVPGSN